MPTETGNGDEAEVLLRPTASEFHFHSTALAPGGVHDGNAGLVATPLRWWTWRVSAAPAL